MKRMVGSLVAIGIVLLVTSNARADDITDWNETMLRAGLVASSSPLVMTRNAAMVHAAMFDAVNGIDRRYTSIHVDPAGPAGASRRAAAVQAAYAILTKLYGSGAATPNAAQQATLDARRIVSLMDIWADESSASINSGVTWGQFVADAIWTWRSTDGFAITGAAPEGSLVGEWRRTPNLPVSTESLRTRRRLPAVFGYGAVADGFALGVSARRTAASHEPRVRKGLQRSKNDGQRRERGSNTRRDHVFVVLEFSVGHLLLESRDAISHRVSERGR